jgi:transcriptional regulator with XRE-family HTH domain
MKPKKVFTSRERQEEKTEFGKHIGEYLRRAREKRGVTQEDLSMDAGYYRTYVNKIERGKYSPSLHTIWRLADSLDMTLEEFFKEFDDDKKKS